MNLALFSTSGLLTIHAWETSSCACGEMRFSLSPFFDLSRYTEGMMLAATADAPVPLPISTNPLKVVAKQYNMSKSEIIAQYRAASGGQDYLDVMDQSQAWFFERGILNVSPTEWMAASHQRLVQSGRTRSRPLTRSVRFTRTAPGQVCC